MLVVIPEETVIQEPVSKNFADVTSYGKEGVEDMHLDELL